MAEPLNAAAMTRGAHTEFVRYLLAGVVNTGVGYCAFLLLIWAAGLDPHVANAASYAIGLLVALLMNRFFVFAGAQVTAGAVSRFAAGFAVSYGMNLATFSLLLAFGMKAAVAQLFAMAVYTLSFYAINRLWVWRRQQA